MRRLLTKLRAALPRPETLARDASGLAGAGLIAYGAAEIYHPLGWILLGAVLVAGAVLSARGAG